MKPVRLQTLLDPGKIIPFYQERNGGGVLPLAPIAVEIHWTSKCNYNCYHCSYGSRRQSRNALTQPVIASLIDDLIEMGCQATYLSGGGEPTVLENWDSHASRLMSSGMEVALITNSVAIRDHHLPIVRQMNYVAVSVYSTNEMRYREITGGHSFANQFSLPEQIKANPTSTIVGARCVINKFNFDEIDLIYSKAMAAGFDYIIFIPAVDYEDRNVGLDKNEIAFVKRKISAVPGFYDPDKTNAVGLLQKNVSHYQPRNYLDDLPTSPPAGCKAIEIRSGAFVNYDGGLYLCQPDIGNQAYAIGNLFEKRFVEIWGGARHLQVIKKLHERYSNGACRSCRAIAFNQNMYKYDAGLVGETTDYERDPFV